MLIVDSDKAVSRLCLNVVDRGCFAPSNCPAILSQLCASVTVLSCGLACDRIAYCRDDLTWLATSVWNAQS